MHLHQLTAKTIDLHAPRAMRTLRTILVHRPDHERMRLRHLLSLFPEIEIVGERDDGRSALNLLRECAPDLLFIGVALDDVGGFDVVESLPRGGRVSVIFCSHDETCARRAFDVGALDYICYPLSQERLGRTIRRACERVEQDARSGVSGHSDATPALDRIAVKEKDRITFVRVDDIDWFEAAADYVCLHAGPRKHTIRARIGELERRLDPAHFVRIHRSTIVNIDRVSELRPMFHGEYQVVLSNNAVLTLSRGYHGRFSLRMFNPF